MDLYLSREYFPTGTNGVYTVGESTPGEHRAYACKCIELPWKDNQRRVSCIPEGRYRLRKRWTAAKGWHFTIDDVPGRSDVLIHAANDAVRELKGCQGPVTTLTGPGKGSASRKALALLASILYPYLDKGEAVWLTVTSKTGPPKWSFK